MFLCPYGDYDILHQLQDNHLLKDDGMLVQDPTQGNSRLGVSHLTLNNSEQLTTI